MDFIKNNKRLVAILAAVPALLLIPFVGMFLTNEIYWNAFDFIVAGLLLFSTGIALELILRKIKTRRLLFIMVLFFALFLVWAELAVGIF